MLRTMPQHRLCSLEDAPKAGAAASFAAAGKAIALFNISGQFHAIEDSCPHMYFPLSDGDIAGCVVTCAYHGWQFDIGTGKSLMSEHIRVKRFDVHVRDGAVWIELLT